jgi:hypothetical protein
MPLHQEALQRTVNSKCSGICTGNVKLTKSSLFFNNHLIEVIPEKFFTVLSLPFFPLNVHSGDIWKDAKWVQKISLEASTHLR